MGRRRRREIVKPAPGVGKCWRIGAGGKRYPVEEPGPVDYEKLVAESDRVAARLMTETISHEGEST
tara:strand:- start:30 stop:227 length:198 start_codon:yes stop_codon:yes gene_type:complete